LTKIRATVQTSRTSQSTFGYWSQNVEEFLPGEVVRVFCFSQACELPSPACCVGGSYSGSYFSSYSTSVPVSCARIPPAFQFLVLVSRFLGARIPCFHTNRGM
jgi:hypothetical protein